MCRVHRTSVCTRAVFVQAMCAKWPTFGVALVAVTIFVGRAGRMGDGTSQCIGCGAHGVASRVSRIVERGIVFIVGSLDLCSVRAAIASAMHA